MKKLCIILFLFSSLSAFAAAKHFTALKMVTSPNGILYCATLESGLLSSNDNGNTWIPLNNGLPLKKVYPFTGVEYRPITSVYLDPVNSRRIAVAVSSSVYISENRGKQWEKIPLHGVVKKTNYITAVALSAVEKDKIFIGTSFNGIFESPDRGKTWRRFHVLQTPFYRGAHFYEEITAMAFNKDDSICAVANGLENTLYLSSNNKKFHPLKVPDLGSEQIRTLEWKDQTLSFYTLKHVYYYTKNGWTYSPLSFKAADSNSKTGRLRRKIADNKTGLYVNSFHASGNSLDTLLKVIKSNGFNSMVVDMKDDEGKITYNTSLDLPYKLQAVRVRFNIEDLIKKAHSAGIYLIGRIVTFKDPMLYRYNNNSYALRDKKSNKPWGNLVKRIDKKTGKDIFVQTEFWVNPFSPFVQKYNISIARELQNLGVDEVQCDYIRFPSDGDIDRILFRDRRPGMNRIDALESFVRRLREKLTIPVGMDLYGFNSWYRMGNWIGQDIVMLSQYVDVISPMFYPSHFPKGFMEDTDYLNWAEMLYRTGTERARKITGNRVVIRPYVQAFLMGKELKMDKNLYTCYLKRELKGAREGGAGGFTLWNNSNRYYMLDAFKK